MEKQIKEMAKILCTDCDMGKCMVDGFDCLEGHCSKRERIEALYNAGYRKSSEVAGEIFEAIENMLIDSSMLPECVRFIDIDELVKLKKKYTEGNDEK